MKKRRTVKGARFVMVTIVGLLMASGVMRSGLIGIAIAANDAAQPEKISPEPAGDTDIAALLAKIKGRAEKLDARERKLDTKSANLDIAAQTIERKLAELKAAEASLRETVAFVDGAAEDDLTKLTTVYEQMKPKTAVPLFEQMTPGFAAGFLARMRPDVSAPIIAGLTAEHAYAISVILAGRNVGAPEK